MRWLIWDGMAATTLRGGGRRVFFMGGGKREGGTEGRRRVRRRCKRQRNGPTAFWKWCTQDEGEGREKIEAGSQGAVEGSESL